MKPDVITRDSAEALWVVADRIRFRGRLPGSALELIEVDVPPGSGTPPHVHASPEMFHVVEGTLTIRSFAGPVPEAAEVGPGGTVRVAPWAPHNYSNDSRRPVRMLVLLEDTMTAFFRDIGTAERPEHPDFAAIAAAMARHGIRLVGPAGGDGPADGDRSGRDTAALAVS